MGLESADFLNPINGEWTFGTDEIDEWDVVEPNGDQLTTDDSDEILDDDFFVDEVSPDVEVNSDSNRRFSIHEDVDEEDDVDLSFNFDEDITSCSSEKDASLPPSKNSSSIAAMITESDSQDDSEWIESVSSGSPQMQSLQATSNIVIDNDGGFNDDEFWFDSEYDEDDSDDDDLEIDWDDEELLINNSKLIPVAGGMDLFLIPSEVSTVHAAVTTPVSETLQQQERQE